MKSVSLLLLIAVIASVYAFAESARMDDNLSKGMNNSMLGLNLDILVSIKLLNDQLKEN